MNTALALTWATFSRSLTARIATALVAVFAPSFAIGGVALARSGAVTGPSAVKFAPFAVGTVRRRIVPAAWSDSHRGDGARRRLCRGLAVWPRVGRQDDRLAVLPARLAHVDRLGQGRDRLAWVLACVTFAVGAAAIAIAVADAGAPRRVDVARARPRLGGRGR